MVFIVNIQVEINAISFNQLMIYLSPKPRKGCIYIESKSPSVTTPIETILNVAGR